MSTRCGAAIAIACALFACGDGPRRCLFIDRGDKVIVVVRDAQTRAEICDARVFVGSMAGGDRLELPVDESCLYAAYVSGGPYLVDVGHPSYQSVRREDVRTNRVKVDGCPESIARVDVELEH